MANYQAFAGNVIGAMQPQQDQTQQRLLLGYKIKSDAENRALQQEESRLARSFQERRLGLMEKGEARAAKKDEREASVADIELGQKLNGIALQRAMAAGDEQSWRAIVTQTAQEFEAVRPGLGATILPYADRFADREKLIEGMVDIDTRYKAMLDRQPLSPEVEAQKARLARAGSSQTTLNVGDGMKFGQIPPGHVLRQTPDGGYAMEPVPGSPAAREIATVEEKKGLAEAGKVQKGDLLIEEINRAFKVMDSATLPTTGGAGDALSAIGGTGARDLRALLDTVRSNVGFDRLTAMRNESPTGGALGAISDRELGRLEAVKGSLEQSQSADQLKYNLRRLHNEYLDVVHGEGKGPPRMPLTGGEAKAPSDADYSKMSDEEVLENLRSRGLLK